jgi:hypothetical protein
MDSEGPKESSYTVFVLRASNITFDEWNRAQDELFGLIETFPIVGVRHEYYFIEERFFEKGALIDSVAGLFFPAGIDLDRASESVKSYFGATTKIYLRFQ